MIKQEYAPGGKEHHFTHTPAYYVLNILEFSMATISLIVIGFYSISNPFYSDWVPGFLNWHMGLVYSMLTIIGFAFSSYITKLTNRELQISGSIHISLASALLKLSPPFAAVCGIGGTILTVGLNGTAVLLGVFLLYGFGLGFLVSRGILSLMGFRKWDVIQVLEEGGTKEGVFPELILFKR